MNNNPLLQLIEEQKQSLVYADFIEWYGSPKEIENWYTESIKAVLENVREGMYKLNKDTLFLSPVIFTKEMCGENISPIWNIELKKQIDLLTETINSLSDVGGTN